MSKYTPRTGLKAVPFDELQEMYLENRNEKDWFKPWLLSTNMKAYSETVLPQLRAYLATFKLNSAGEGGTISGTQFWADNVAPDDLWSIGLYRFLTLPTSRGDIVRDQTTKGLAFNAFVPLVLSAFKFASNVPYNKWDRGTLHKVVDPQLLEFMLFQSEFQEAEDYFISRFGFSTDELLQFREASLVVGSGDRKGTRMQPTKAVSITKVANPRFKALSRLVKIAACQIWCAHPSNYTEYAVLDPVDWDNKPPELQQEDIFIPGVRKPKKEPEEELVIDTPWD